MKVLITGASGLLGRALMDAFSEEDVLGLAYSRAAGNLKKLDITDPEAVNACISEYKPEVIIHSAAVRTPDTCQNDPEYTYKMNVGATASVVESALKCGAWVLYISSDYVFDGTNPPYMADDQTNPVNIYGKSKLEGEEVMRSQMPDGGILRVPILYGPVKDLEECGITQLIKQVLSGESGIVEAWATRYPTHVADVANVCFLLANAWCANNKNVRLGGVFQFSGDEPVTKADMAKIIGNIAKKDISQLKVDSSGPIGAPRPQDCHLDCSRLEELFELKRTPFEDGLSSIISKI
ncbi:hypothetical protein BVX94_00875 [bacterium B17]|nr:hypothetical protein BVX94_00875 [bacterium B17]